MTPDYFAYGVSATNAVIDNQLAVEAIEREQDDALFAAGDAYSWDRDEQGDD